ncbi:hypothetical protein VKT23_010103 [Stygiomarasmius scandens]|uniref:Uncharacterized protein n=1 Tax=Marasmiellus scandens TaxID=2682957 RepID=A0ABR1JFF3_9AGAR
MTSSPKPDLSKIFTPTLYTEAYKLAFPWTPKPDGALDVKWMIGFYSRGVPDPGREIFDTLHHQVLKPISQFCPSVPEDLVSGAYLPPVTDPLYPERVLALLFILDQAPRRLYNGSGMNARYTFGYFDAIVGALVKNLISRDALPDSTEALMKLGYSFEEAMIRKLNFYSPIVHSEDIADHDWAHAKTLEMRREVEDYSGKTDPARATRETDLKDPKMFFKLFTSEGPPDTEDFAEFMFWYYRVFDVHKALLSRFGRYPYRNTALGRVSTEEEVKFIEETGGFGRARLTDEEVERIRKQSEEGVWEPLNDKEPF